MDQGVEWITNDYSTGNHEMIFFGGFVMMEKVTNESETNDGIPRKRSWKVLEELTEYTLIIEKIWN